MSRRNSGDPGTAEEISLDAFLQVWRQADRYQGDQGTLSSWLFTIARSRAIDRVRAAGAAKRTRAEDPDVLSPAGQPEDMADVARSELDGARGTLQRLTEQLAAKEKDVTALRAALAAAEESLTIVQAPGLQLVRLKETPTAPPAEAHVLISRDTHRALFYAFDLPAPPTDKVYELWWITEKEGPVNAGLFQPNPQGIGRVDTTVPPDAGAIHAAAVTVEPAGGVPKPTGQWYCSGMWSKAVESSKA